MLHHLLNCRTTFFWDNKFHLQHNVSTMIFPASRPVAEMRVGCRSMFFHAQNADQWLPQQYIFTPTHTIYSALKQAHPLLFQFGKHTCPWVIYPQVFAKPAPAPTRTCQTCTCGMWVWVLIGMRAGCGGKPQGSLTFPNYVWHLVPYRSLLYPEDACELTHGI